MNIQIFGSKKCRETKKAKLFFQERRIPFQYVELAEKNLSKGEFDSIKTAVGLENMIDRESKEYEKRNLKFMVFQIENILMEVPELYKTPLVRNGRTATTGYQPEKWVEWLSQDGKIPEQPRMA